MSKRIQPEKKAQLLGDEVAMGFPIRTLINRFTKTLQMKKYK